MKNNIIVKFKDEDHSYWRGKSQYTSVNKLLGKFGFHFDEDFWLVYKGLQLVVPQFGKKYFSLGFNFDDRKPEVNELIDSFQSYVDKSNFTIGELCAQIKDSWNESSEKGTEFHLDRESEAYRDGYLMNPYTNTKFDVKVKPEPSKGYDNESNLNYLKNLEDGAYCELVLFSPEHLLAGQSDETFIETIDGIRYVDIGDHKTNKKLPKISNRNGTCFHPIDHIDDCTFSKYQLQVSMYAHLLERLGYVARNVGFYHYKKYDPSTKNVIEVDYLGNECKNILSYYKENVLDS